jgi:hypothetical protein
MVGGGAIHEQWFHPLYSGVARTGGWTFYRIAPAWGAAATLMAGGRSLSLLGGGGGEKGYDRPHRRRWVAAVPFGGGMKGEIK